jgi:hypothetical protein
MIDDQICYGTTTRETGGLSMWGGSAFPIMIRIIFALMDSDGDGTVSLQEFQAAHERIFKGMERPNKDGPASLWSRSRPSCREPGDRYRSSRAFKTDLVSPLITEAWRAPAPQGSRAGTKPDVKSQGQESESL